jgi:DNA-binding winged helix-turn-helix (wHTH) protein
MGDADDTLRFGSYTLHRVQGLTCGTNEVRVTQKALRVLWALARRAGDTVTKEELFREVWPDVAVGDAALTTCIRELRAAFRDDARRPSFIETRHRQGFRFVAPTRSAQEHASKRLAAQLPPPGLCVGRERELEVLQSTLQTARAGSRQLVVLAGEAGIGKTTLLRTFVDGLNGDEAAAVTGATCADAAGGCEPYRPLLDSVSMLCTRSSSDRGSMMLRRYAPSWWLQFPAFHEVADGPNAPPGSVTSTRMSRELSDYIEALADTHTVLLWIDDLQWGDAATLDWLASFMARVHAARVMILVALRSDRQTRAHDVLAQLQARPSCRGVTLPGLDLSAVADLVRHQRGDGPDVMVLASQLHTRTEGHALFVSLLAEELTPVVSSSGRRSMTATATDRGGRAVAPGPVPERLRDAIDAQIAYLDANEVELLEIASLIVGAEWPAALVAAAADRPVLEVEQALKRMSRRWTFVRHTGSARWPDGTASETFAFRHALHRGALREQIGAHRAAILHARIGHRLEAAFGARARELALPLALHFEEAAQGGKAIAYLLEAASAANRVGAVSDAAHHLSHAIAVLDSEPPSRERDEREAELQVRLGAALMAARGWGASEAERAFVRALELYGGSQDSLSRFSVYWGLWLFRWGRGELLEAQALVERLAQVGSGSTDPMLRLQVLHARWATSSSLGDLEQSLAYANTGWAVWREGVGDEGMLAYGNHHAGVCARGFGARALAMLGESDLARRAADEAVTTARRFSHPFTMAIGLILAGMAYQTLNDEETTRRLAEDAEAVSVEHGFTLMLAWARALKGWAVRNRSAAKALEIAREAVTGAVATGSRQFHTWLLGVLAETQLAAGLVEDGWNTVDEAIAYADMTGERFYVGQLHRIRDELTARARLS